jgi:hypothetical protein
MDSRPPSAFPPKIIGADGRRLHVVACRKTWCRKCRESATAAYVDDAGRAWPTCLRCARRAAKIPCPHCGDTTPAMVTFHRAPGEEKGRTAFEHESGARCFPLDVNDRYRLPCSSCGAAITFRLLASVAVFGGTRDELACAGCGARWAVVGMRLGINVCLVA